MKLIDIISIVDENLTVIVRDRALNCLAVYDGRDSIDLDNDLKVVMLWSYNDITNIIVE